MKLPIETIILVAFLVHQSDSFAPQSGGQKAVANRAAYHQTSLKLQSEDGDVSKSKLAPMEKAVQQLRAEMLQEIERAPFPRGPLTSFAAVGGGAVGLFLNLMLQAQVGVAATTFTAPVFFAVMLYGMSSSVTQNDGTKQRLPEKESEFWMGIGKNADSQSWMETIESQEGLLQLEKMFVEQRMQGLRAKAASAAALRASESDEEFDFDLTSEEFNGIKEWDDDSVPNSGTVVPKVPYVDPTSSGSEDTTGSSSMGTDMDTIDPSPEAPKPFFIINDTVDEESSNKIVDAYEAAAAATKEEKSSANNVGKKVSVKSVLDNLKKGDFEDNLEGSSRNNTIATKGRGPLSKAATTKGAQVATLSKSSTFMSFGSTTIGGKKEEEMVDVKENEVNDESNEEEALSLIREQSRALKERFDGLNSLKPPMSSTKIYSLDGDESNTFRVEAKARALKERIEKLKAAKERAKVDAEKEMERLQEEAEHEAEKIKAGAQARTNQKLNEKEAEKELQELKEEAEQLKRIQAQAEKLQQLKAEEEELLKLKAEQDELLKLKEEQDKLLLLKAKAKEEAKRKEEAEERAKIEAEREIARLKAEAVELAKLKAEEEKARLKAEADEKAKVKAEAEEQARIKAETEEKARIQAEKEEIAKLKAEAEEIAKLKAEAEEQARIKAETEEKARIQAEKEKIAKLKAEAEEIAKLKAEAEELARLKAEEEAKSKAEAEEQARIIAEEESAKSKAEAEEITRLKAETDEMTQLTEKEKAKLNTDEDTKLKSTEEENLLAEEEARIKAEGNEETIESKQKEGVSEMNKGITTDESQLKEEIANTSEISKATNTSPSPNDLRRKIRELRVQKMREKMGNGGPNVTFPSRKERQVSKPVPSPRKDRSPRTSRANRITPSKLQNSSAKSRGTVAPRTSPANRVIPTKLQSSSAKSSYVGPSSSTGGNISSFPTPRNMPPSPTRSPGMVPFGAVKIPRPSPSDFGDMRGSMNGDFGDGNFGQQSQPPNNMQGSSYGASYGATANTNSPPVPYPSPKYPASSRNQSPGSGGPPMDNVMNGYSNVNYSGQQSRSRDDIRGGTSYGAESGNTYSPVPFPTPRNMPPPPSRSPGFVPFGSNPFPRPGGPPMDDIMNEGVDNYYSGQQSFDSDSQNGFGEQFTGGQSYIPPPTTVPAPSRSPGMTPFGGFTRGLQNNGGSNDMRGGGNSGFGQPQQNYGSPSPFEQGYNQQQQSFDPNWYKPEYEMPPSPRDSPGMVPFGSSKKRKFRDESAVPKEPPKWQQQQFPRVSPDFDQNNINAQDSGVPYSSAQEFNQYESPSRSPGMMPFDSTSGRQFRSMNETSWGSDSQRNFQQPPQSPQEQFYQQQGYRDPSYYPKQQDNMIPPPPSRSPGMIPFGTMKYRKFRDMDNEDSSNNGNKNQQQGYNSMGQQDTPNMNPYENLGFQSPSRSPGSVPFGSSKGRSFREMTDEEDDDGERSGPFNFNNDNKDDEDEDDDDDYNSGPIKPIINDYPPTFNPNGGTNGYSPPPRSSPNSNGEKPNGRGDYGGNGWNMGLTTIDQTSTSSGFTSVIGIKNDDSSSDITLVSNSDAEASTSKENFMNAWLSNVGKPSTSIPVVGVRPPRVPAGALGQARWDMDPFDPYMDGPGPMDGPVPMDGIDPMVGLGPMDDPRMMDDPYMGGLDGYGDEETIYRSRMAQARALRDQIGEIQATRDRMGGQRERWRERDSRDFRASGGPAYRDDLWGSIGPDYPVRPRWDRTQPAPSPRSPPISSPQYQTPRESRIGNDDTRRDKNVGAFDRFRENLNRRDPRSEQFPPPRDGRYDNAYVNDNIYAGDMPPPPYMDGPDFYGDMRPEDEMYGEMYDQRPDAVDSFSGFRDNLYGSTDGDGSVPSRRERVKNDRPRDSAAIPVPSSPISSPEKAIPVNSETYRRSRSRTGRRIDIDANNNYRESENEEKIFTYDKRRNSQRGYPPPNMGTKPAEEDPFGGFRDNLYGGTRTDPQNANKRTPRERKSTRSEATANNFRDGLYKTTNLEPPNKTSKDRKYAEKSDKDPFGGFRDNIYGSNEAPTRNQVKENVSRGTKVKSSTSTGTVKNNFRDGTRSSVQENVSRGTAVKSSVGTGAAKNSFRDGLYKTSNLEPPNPSVRINSTPGSSGTSSNNFVDNLYGARNTTALSGTPKSASNIGKGAARHSFRDSLYQSSYLQPPKGRFSSILKKSSPAFNSLRDSTRTFDRISSPEGMKPLKRRSRVAKTKSGARDRVSSSDRRDVTTNTVSNRKQKQSKLKDFASRSSKYENVAGSKRMKPLESVSVYGGKDIKDDKPSRTSQKQPTTSTNRTPPPKTPPVSMSPKGDIADKPKADTMAGSGSYLDAFNKAPSPSSSPQSFASAPKKKMVNEPKSKVDTMAGSGSYLDAFNKAPSPSSSPKTFAPAPKKEMFDNQKAKVDTMAGSGSYLDAFNKTPSPSSSPQSFTPAPKKKMVEKPKSDMSVGSAFNKAPSPSNTPSTAAVPKWKQPAASKKNESSSSPMAGATSYLDAFKNSPSSSSKTPDPKNAPSTPKNKVSSIFSSFGAAPSGSEEKNEEKSQEGLFGSASSFFDAFKKAPTPSNTSKSSPVPKSEQNASKSPSSDGMVGATSYLDAFNKAPSPSNSSPPTAPVPKWKQNASKSSSPDGMVGATSYLDAFNKAPSPSKSSAPTAPAPKWKQQEPKKADSTSSGMAGGSPASKDASTPSGDVSETVSSMFSSFGASGGSQSESAKLFEQGQKQQEATPSINTTPAAPVPAPEPEAKPAAEGMAGGASYQNAFNDSSQTNDGGDSSSPSSDGMAGGSSYLDAFSNSPSSPSAAPQKPVPKWKQGKQGNDTPPKKNDSGWGSSSFW